MGSETNTIGVRTKHDREEEERYSKLMERIQHENWNPFQAFADPIVATSRHIYDTYLYSSGVLFCLLAFWAAYPSFARFRHTHLLRYRRLQLTFRRGFFATEHLPKWDKKHLQRLVVPPLPPKELWCAKLETEAAAAALSSTSTRFSKAVAVPAPVADAVVTPAPNEKRPYESTEITVAHTARGNFDAGDTERSERALAEQMRLINKEFYQPQSLRFDQPILAESVDEGDLQARLKAAVAAANAVVVMKENHSNSRSIPEGWEVWWVSAPEAKRRWFCKFWLCALACARGFQDLMEMPDMPDFVN